MKRFVSLILSVCFLFSINTVSYAANISSRKASNPVIQSIPLVESPAHFVARQQACIQIAAAIYTQARLRTSLFCFLLYQLSLWWVKYRAQPEAIST